MPRHGLNARRKSNLTTLRRDLLSGVELLEPRIVLDASIVISEFVADNGKGLDDEDGDRTDWIELYNAGTSTTDLTGWYLTDNPETKNKWAFPKTSLDAGRYLLIHASGKDRATAEQPLHTNFQLDADGESVLLVKKDGKTVADNAGTFGNQKVDVAFGIRQDTDNHTLVASGSPARWIVPSLENGSDQIGTSWTAVDFDDSSWAEGTSNIGFEKRTGFEEFIGTDLQDAMADSATAYVRIPFEFPSASAVFSLVLSMRYDDGFIAYLNGTRIASTNAPDNPAWDSDSDGTNRDTAAVVFEDFDVSHFASLLRTGSNVLAIHAMNTNVSSDDFLMVPRLTALQPGTVTSTERGYLARPTPGGPNGTTTYSEFIPNVDVDVPRGLYDSPFDLTLSTELAGATIVYTTDGSRPALDNGTLVAVNNPEETARVALRIERTTALRVGAFKDDFLPANVETHTYIFVDDIASQTAQATIDVGFPEAWGDRTPDYGIDPNVVGPNDQFEGLYSNQFSDSLESIPSMSIVMSNEDLFDAETGIYANSESSGREWERPTSVELILPDGGEGFQVDAGIRILGGFSRRAGKKHSLRLEFRGVYGPTRLRYPLFGESAATDFDTLVLRAGFNDSWVWTPESTHYVRDQWTRDTQRLMGHPSSHGTYVHLYINGLYWGMYNPSERPDASFSESYFGGDESNWDALNSGDPVDGTDDAWRQLRQLARDAGKSNQTESNAAFLKLLGRKPDGTNDPELETLLDIDNYIDYMILNYYIGNTDWPGKNFYVARERGPESTGFKFYSWDAERSLNDEEGAHVGVNMLKTTGGVASLISPLRRNDEFRLMFADRVHRHFFNGGLLYVNPDHPQVDEAHPENNIPATRYRELAEQIALPLVAESARWGDTRRTQAALTIADWQALLDDAYANYFPQRSANVLAQLIDRDLYPTTEAPVFSQHGGPVESNFDLQMVGPGEIYFTLDGSDPRQSILEPGVLESGVLESGVRPGTHQYSSPIKIDSPTIVKARSFADGIWSALTEATFTTAKNPLRISELMYHPNATDEELIVDGVKIEESDYEYIELMNTADVAIDLSGLSFDAGVSFSFPETSVQAGERVIVARHEGAFRHRYGTDATVLGEYGPEGGKLSNGGETIRLVDSVGTVIQELSYADDWYAATDGDGPSLTLRNVSDDSAPKNPRDAWTLSLGTHGTPGQEDRADLQNDGSLNIDDVDLICAQLTSSNSRLDFNQDGMVNNSDVTAVIKKTFQTSLGDVNLDGRFDSDDLIRVFQSGKFEDNIANNAKWSEGDWNCDGDFTTEDLVTVFQAGTFVAQVNVAATPHLSAEMSASIAAAIDSKLEQNPWPWRAHHRSGQA
ncbi:MAG: hypothetical protein GY768_19395 [Planctomycetaceae bacterium]|nr:hypothetical protein [Planctomycetaceae bacterium]